MTRNDFCCFDSSEYTGIPDAAPTDHPLDVPSVIKERDRFNASGREKEGEKFLERRTEEARRVGDWRAELSFLNELLGQYRRSRSGEKGLAVVESALAVLREHRLGYTVSGATVIINAATTMNCFGLAKESIPLFSHAAKVYADRLDPKDYRFAGLYNNMALSYRDSGDDEAALTYFRLAMKVLESCRHPENELAVTLCNMAELYDRRDPENENIGKCMERAWEALNTPGLPRDAYHAFTISKCVPTFDHFGYFLYSMELKKRGQEIYEREKYE